MYSEKEINNVTNLMSQRMENATQNTLNLIAKRVKNIGNADKNDLVKLSNIDADMKKINSYISNATSMNIRDTKNVYDTFAKDTYNASKETYNFTGVEMVAYDKNENIKNIVAEQSRATKDALLSIPQTSVFALKDEKGNVVYSNIDVAYKSIVNKAISSVNAGVTNYQYEMRKILKQYADSGIRTVDYKSGISRDIYSVVRMNLLDGIRKLNNSVRLQTGKEFGADGVEISVHGLCAPDHIDIQGEQYSIKDFEKLDNSLDRPIGTCNCQHSIFPIVLGISKPVYDKDELERIKYDNLNVFVIIDGKKYTKYQASQLQRKLENEIRKTKREMNTAKECGDSEGYNIYRNKLRQLSAKYKSISEQAGLSEKKNRL